MKRLQNQRQKKSRLRRKTVFLCKKLNCQKSYPIKSKKSQSRARLNMIVKVSMEAPKKRMNLVRKSKKRWLLLQRHNARGPSRKVHKQLKYQLYLSKLLNQNTKVNMIVKVKML